MQINVPKKIIEENKKLQIDDCLDNKSLNQFIYKVKKEHNEFSNMSDVEMLDVMGILKEGKLTLAGKMMFSKSPQTHYPHLCIKAMAVAGTEIINLNNNSESVIDYKSISGNISDMLTEALDFVWRNSRIKTIINKDGYRKDKSEYPMLAIREAILNALVFRDYRNNLENMPITLIMYRDRLEIINSIDLSLERYNEIDNINHVLAVILGFLNIKENKHSGIMKIFNECEKAKLTSPIFQIEQRKFKVIFKNNI